MPTKGLYGRSIGLTPGSLRLLFARGFLPAAAAAAAALADWFLRRLHAHVAEP